MTKKFQLTHNVKNHKCYWLPQELVDYAAQVSEECFQHAPIPQNHVDISVQLNKDADIYQPISDRTGFRSSDIELLENPSSDPRVVNSILSRRIADVESSHAGISDEVMAENVAPTEMTIGDAMLLADNLHEYINQTALESNPEPVPESTSVPKSE